MKTVVIAYSVDNYAYLIICEKSGRAAIVDPGEGSPVLRAVQEYGVQLTAILCTHHHADHIDGVEMILSEIPGVEVYCHVSDEKRVTGVSCLLSDGDIFQMGELEVTLMHTPGHTLGSVVYSAENSIFVGDTLFGAGCGRLFEGTVEQMFESLEKIRLQFPPETQIYFGHEYTRKNLQFAQSFDEGNPQVEDRFHGTLDEAGGLQVTTPSTLSLEYKTNPFLRCSLIELEGCSSPLEVFAYLRKERNNF